MAILDFFSYSIENLRHRKLRSWLTMIGIFIGIAAVVALIGLGEGLRGAITGQFGFLGPDVLAVQASGLNFAGPPGQAVVNPLTKDLTEKIKSIPGVDIAVNRYIETGAFEFNDIQDIVFAWNVPENKERSKFEKMLNLKVSQGRLLKDGDKFKVVLGNSFTDEDRFGKPIQVGNNIIFEGKQFEVVGILEKKGSFIFDTAVIMNEDVLISEFKDDDSVNAIAIKVNDLKSIGNVKRNVEELLRKERGVKEGEEDFTVQSPESALESLDDVLFGVQLFISIIAFISLVVGGIGITNTMYTAVLERTKEIGIMKSIGARNSSIFTLFFMESGFLGFVGGLIGVAIGVALANLFAFAGRQALGSDLIKADVSLALVFGSLLFSVIVGLIAGTVPAYHASKKNPVDALRFAK
ncbi:ABC transporter permease [Candidatus Woesearchaeota archaeon]|nr:ABC transporter permease [Candidatus Woesearchaeota archaeon]